MSNRALEFTANTFHNAWNEFKLSVNSIDSSITDINTVEEIARLKKVINYIDGYLSLVEPDLNKNNVLTPLLANLISTINFVNQYKQQANIAFLVNANQQIDNLLTGIKALNILLPSNIEGSAISEMLSTYNKTIFDALRNIDLPAVVQASNEIKKLKSELIDNTDSVRANVISESAGIQRIYSELKNLHDEILLDMLDKPSIKTKIITVTNDISNEIELITKRITDISPKIDEIDVFYEKVNELSQDIDNRLKEITEITNNQKSVYLALENEIRGLLSSAITVGLGKAYADERKKFTNPIMIWNGVFIAIVFIIFALGFYSFCEFITLTASGKPIIEINQLLLRSLPMTIPLVWLALYASKRRSENQRLEQEYAHKEALANSYMGYKEQAELLKEQDPQLVTKLLSCAIDAISYNASNTLDKKHGDGTILGNTVNQITKGVKK